MTLTRTSLSLSIELDQALDVLVARSGQPKSRLVEVLLRENAMVAQAVESVRLEAQTEPVAVPGVRRKVRVAPRAPSRHS